MPGPAIGYLQECLRWWDYWLKGIETGIMDEPAWPAPSIKPKRLYLNLGGVLGARAGKPVALTHVSEQTIGLGGGEWCPHGIGGYGPQYPTDQREDDVRSLVFETAPLDRTVEILGQPKVTLALAVDRPVAYVAVRLNDVFPDGRVSRATYGVLNLTYRESHEFAKPMPVGRRLSVTVPLNDIPYGFRAGHRIRVAISTTYWPMVWPSPEVVTLKLTTGLSSLELPVRQRRPIDAKVRFKEPEHCPPMAKSVIEPSSFYRIVERDIGTGTVTVRAEENDGSAVIADTGAEIGRWLKETVRITEGDPLSAETEMGSIFTYGKGAWLTKVHGRYRLMATRDTWLLSADLDAWEGETKIFSRHLDVPIKRDLI